MTTAQRQQAVESSVCGSYTRWSGEEADGSEHTGWGV